MSDSEASGAEAAPPDAGGHFFRDGMFYRHWVPRLPPAGVVLLVHGLAEHSGRYESVAERLTGKGVVVLAPDLPGHGCSPGRPLFVSRFEEYLKPVRRLRNAIDTWYPGLPCFLLGHSMGGLIAVDLLLTQQARFAGAMLSGPALRLPRAPSLPFYIGARVLSLLAPRLGLIGVDASLISRDPEVVQRYLDDPLVCKGRVSARLATEVADTMTRVRRRRGSLELPLLVQHGARDALAASVGSREFIAGVGAKDRTLRIYPELYHEIFNEPERETVLSDLEEWLQARLEHGREE